MNLSHCLFLIHDCNSTRNLIDTNSFAYYESDENKYVEVPELSMVKFSVCSRN